MAQATFIEESGQLRLVKDRNAGIKRWGFVTAIGAGLLLLGIILFFFIAVFAGVLLFAGLIALLFSLPQLWRFISKGEWVTFNRAADSISENDKPLCKISELQGIQVERYTRMSKAGKPYFTKYYTYLLLPNNIRQELDFDSEPTNPEAIGTRVATYLGLELQHKETVNQES